MVEVFKTNITNAKSAKPILIALSKLLPNSYINFDLEDCDNILRIENCNINPNVIIDVLNSSGFYCEPLP